MAARIRPIIRQRRCNSYGRSEFILFLTSNKLPFHRHLYDIRTCIAEIGLDWIQLD